MRTRSFTVLGLGLGLGLGLLTGCSGSSSGGDASIAEAKSSLARDMAPSVSDADKSALAEDNTKFALDAYGSLAKSESGNIFFSPYSISSALAMTYAGANGQTATEMASALHFSLPQDRLHPAFDAVDLSLTAAAPQTKDADGNPVVPFTLHIANSMWGATQLTFGTPFLDTLAKNYGAGVYLEDFVKDPAGAENQINDWVAKQTDDKIQKLLDHNIDQSTRFVLVDAIYFDADWQTPFDKDSTSDGNFTTATGTTTASMMHNSELSALVGQTDTYDAIELPYKGTSVMDIVMPKAGTFSTFEGTLTSDSLQAIVAGLANSEVDLTLPKFGYQGNTISLKPLLRGLGMNVAFTPDADFTAIAKDPSGPIYIGDVLHKAFLRVDEKGTEAAAATAVIGVGTSAHQDVKTITVDHPFFFTIRDTATNTVLFAGRVLDPSQ